MLKIMIIDDDYIISEELKAILQDLGYEVADVAASGEAAIEMAPKIKPDVILMDIVMPGGIDGTKAAQIIMGLIDCTVIFVTGYGNDEIVKRAINVEPHGFIMKPFDPSEIKVSIEIAFRKKQIEDRLRNAYADMLLELQERTSRLEEVNHQLNALLNVPHDSMALLDTAGRVLATNSIMPERLQVKMDEFVGKCFYDLVPKRLAESRKSEFDWVAKTGKSHRFIDRRGNLSFDNSVYPIFGDGGKVIQLAVCEKDITREVDSLKQLGEKKTELESKNELFEQANIALKMMLQKSKENREEIEEEVLSTLKRMITPYVSKIKRAEISPDVREHIDTIETNLKHVASPFSRKLSFEYLSLTPKEIEVANLVRNGKSTKEISEELDITMGTTEFYRNNIRKKLGINGKKIRLRKYLISI